MNKKELFLKIFKKAEKKYGTNEKRLAGEGWTHGWQTLIATIMSAQSRDETTIPIAEELFKKHPSIQSLANAKYSDILVIFKSLNYNKTKARNVISACKFILENFKGRIPDSIEDLIKIPGVGRKTANFVITEIHNKEGICVDTHCHRLLNVLNIVKTKNPTETEFEMMKIAPKHLWSKINRILVLWGKDISGRNKKRLLDKINT